MNAYRSYNSKRTRTSCLPLVIGLLALLTAVVLYSYVM